MAGRSADEVDRPIGSSSVVGICGEDGAQSAGAREGGESQAVGEAREAPGPVVPVEADIVVGGVEALRVALGEVGARGGFARPRQ